jgi:PPK2 family polyphosphate:nucleotide phosphotransferase
MYHEKFIVPTDKEITLADYSPGYSHHFKDESEAKEKLREDISRLSHLQDVLYAEHSHSVLIVFQAMDAAGKDGTIKHVMSGLNPQGCAVAAFKAPSPDELSHDYLWRCITRLPERGKIGVFNRSYYEEVIVVRVHHELLDRQNLPPELVDDKIWKRRFTQINNFEKYLSENGTLILKFFLNVSKGEQGRRLLERLEKPEKNWKYSASDIKERAFWDSYMAAYEAAFNHTSSEYAPWYIIPADHKWFTRVAVADIIVERLKDLKLKYPVVDEKHRDEIVQAKTILQNEIAKAYET